MEKIRKSAFCVIGMPGSTDDGEGFVREKANSRFGEVEALADRIEDGSLKGVWGIMTDMDFTYGPWTDDFTRGRYLAGVESRTDEIAPKGWKKWIVSGFEALKVKIENENTFHDTLKYMNMTIVRELRFIRAEQAFALNSGCLSEKIDDSLLKST